MISRRRPWRCARKVRIVATQELPTRQLPTAATKKRFELGDSLTRMVGTGKAALVGDPQLLHCRQQLAGLIRQASCSNMYR